MSAPTDAAAVADNIAFDSSKLEVKSNEGGEAVVAYADSDAFVSMSGMTKKEVKRFETYTNAYKAAAIETAADEAKKMFKKDKKLESIEFSFPTGTTSAYHLDVNIDREKEYRNMFAKEGEDATIKNSRITVVDVAPFGISKANIKDMQKALYADIAKS